MIVAKAITLILPMVHAEFEGVAGMVNELLSYCDEFEDSHDSS